VLKIQLDVNHDGNMDLTFAGPDNTTVERPFRFWVNNDSDKGENEVPNGPRDDDNDFIESERDLEDFARLWLVGVPNVPAGQGHQMSLSWRVTSGRPAIKLYKSIEPDGGTAYLTDATTSHDILNGLFRFSNVTVSPEQELVLPEAMFNDPSPLHFIFEGAGVGKGELVWTLRQNGQVLASSSTHIELLDVQDMFERAYVYGLKTTHPEMRDELGPSFFGIENAAMVSDSARREFLRG